MKLLPLTSSKTCLKAYFSRVLSTATKVVTKTKRPKMTVIPTNCGLFEERNARSSTFSTRSPTRTCLDVLPNPREYRKATSDISSTQHRPQRQALPYLPNRSRRIPSARKEWSWKRRLRRNHHTLTSSASLGAEQIAVLLKSTDTPPIATPQHEMDMIIHRLHTQLSFYSPEVRTESIGENCAEELARKGRTFVPDLYFRASR